MESTTPGMFEPRGYKEPLPSVKFERLLIPMGQASDETGVPQFRSEYVVHFSFPGMKGHATRTEKEFFGDRERGAIWKQAFGQAFEQFKGGGNAEPISGCPLRDCPVLPAEIRAQFEFLKFQTVEQLLQADPTMTGRVPEGEAYVRKVKRWFEAAHETAKVAVALKENEDLKAQLEAMKKQIEFVNAKYLEVTGQEAPAAGQKKRKGEDK